MTKKISYKDAAYIRKNSKPNFAFKYLCSHTLTDGTEGGHCYTIKSMVKMPFFLLLFLPIAIANVFVCMWDGGLKEYELPTQRVISSWTMYVCDAKYENSMYNKMKKVWERA